MELVFVVVLAALLQYLYFGALVGRARATYGVRAPATVGDPAFERVYRVHQNTLENLIVFVPAIWIFGLQVDARWGAGLGVAFIVARTVYAYGYIRAAEKRAAGAFATAAVNGILVIGALAGAAAALV